MMINASLKARQTLSMILAALVLSVTPVGDAPAQSFRNGCPAMPAPTYTLQIQNVPVRLVENADQATMRSLFSQYNPPGSASLTQHQNIGGLHHGEIRLRTEFHMLQTTQGGRACLGLKELALTLGYEPVIYIARERPRGSCSFDAAIEHEYKHLNTDLAILREATPRIRAAAQRSLQQLTRPRPMPERNLDNARDQLQARLTAILNQEMSTIEAERNRRQALIDTPAEYRRVAQQCAGRR